MPKGPKLMQIHCKLRGLQEQDLKTESEFAPKTVICDINLFNLFGPKKEAQ